MLTVLICSFVCYYGSILEKKFYYLKFVLRENLCTWKGDALCLRVTIHRTDIAGDINQLTGIVIYVFSYGLPYLQRDDICISGLLRLRLRS